MINITDLVDDQKDTYYLVYYACKSDGTNFWEALTNTGEFSENEIKGLKLQAKLSRLTCNNSLLAKSLRRAFR